MGIHKNNLTSYCFLDSDGNILQSIDENLPLIPASNMKLVTSLGALELLGMDYVFTTKFSSLKNGLYISGDPSFFLNKSECGNIVKELDLKNPDHVYFEKPGIDREFYNSDWVYGDSQYSYQPKISNFFIDENCRIKDGFKFDDADLDYIHKNEQLFQPLKNPDRSLLEAFSVKKNAKIMRRSGISNNKFERESTHRANIRDVLKHVLYESCNFYAEVIFKYISSSGNSAGTWKNSSKLMKEYLSKIRGSENVRITDGSGLSRENYLTTGFLSNMLLYARRNFGKSFIELMPTSGYGTLRKRLDSLKDFGIYAKTGTLSGVSALSGYISSLDVTFSIIINNSLDDGAIRQKEIDGILSEFINGYKKKHYS